MDDSSTSSFEELINSPYVLIVVFGVAGMLGLGYVLLGHASPEPGSTGRVPHSPSEYPEIFEKEDPLAGLPKDPKDTRDLAEFPLDPPPWSSDEVFPCSRCHSADELNLTPRKLTADHRKIVLEHGGENRWCFDCHDPNDRDKLRLANGTLVEFEKSYRLCGQCHGTQFRDWKSGIHGKRTGYWNGPKRYLLCAHCHNPHSPKFKPLVPLPAPVRPELLRDEKRERKEGQ